jgi:pilus assembly protein CpaD
MRAVGSSNTQAFSEARDQERRMSNERSSNASRSERRLRLSAGAVLAGIAACALAACDSARIPDEIHPRLTDYSQRHPVVVAAETATLDIPYGAQDKGTSAKSFVETTRFLRDYRQEGRGALNIAVPHGGSHGAYRQVEAVRIAAQRNGVHPRQLRVVEKAGHGTITLSYDRIAAIGPACGDWSEDVTRRAHVLPYNNFGCASQRNIAAMAANPTDLMYPALEPARGSETRGQDFKNYTGGVGKGVGGGGGAAR